jgi:methionyl-tRNA formyltransferase
VQLGARCIVDALGSLDSLVREPQRGDEATYAAKVSKTDARIDWRRGATQIDRQVRAFEPSPGAQATLAGQPVKVWEAWPGEGEGEPGRVLASGDTGVVVACGEGALTLTRLQKPGGRRLAAAEFLRGHPIESGAKFE